MGPGSVAQCSLQGGEGCSWLRAMEVVGDISGSEPGAPGSGAHPRLMVREDDGERAEGVRVHLGKPFVEVVGTTSTVRNGALEVVWRSSDPGSDGGVVSR